MRYSQVVLKEATKGKMKMRLQSTAKILKEEARGCGKVKQCYRERQLD